MKELECPACGEKIHDDSLYCDMCGAELLECVACGTLGVDPFCPECGHPMIARKVNAEGQKTTGSRTKRILLKLRNGDVSIIPEDEALIGRKESRYAELLKDLPLISRRHGKFVLRDGIWHIIDFGSTNGTYINDREVPANTPVKFEKGDKVDIGTYIFDVQEE